MLKMILQKEGKVINYLEQYLKEETLNKWTSLLKISQYAEHTTNYLENFFKNLTNKNICKQKTTSIFKRN